MIAQVALSAEDETTIRGMLRELGEAWARGSGADYGALFTEDARYVTAPGDRIVGRTAIATGHQRIFDTIFRGTRLGRDYPVELQPITPDVVLLHGCGSVLFGGEDERRVPPNGLLTMVALRRDGAWRFAAFHNTPTGRSRNLRFLIRFLRSKLSR